MKNLALVIASSMILALTACGGDSGNNSGGGDDNSSASLSSQFVLSSGEEPTSSEQQGSSGVLSSGGTVSSSKGTSSNTVPGSSVAKSSIGGTSSSSSAGGVSSSSGEITSFTDPRDGQVYPVVRIGTQVWFAKNLNVGTMVEWDGSSNVYTLSTDDTKIEKLCYGNNPSNCDLYGGLYEFYEAMAYPADCGDFDWVDSPSKCKHGSLATGKRGICPVGWHIPDTTEFNVLFKYVGDNGYSGKESLALRAASLINGVDAFGFGVVGGGYVYIGNMWLDVNEEGYIWTSTVDSDLTPRYNNWDSNDGFIVVHDRDTYWFGDARSIRCLQD